jgi:hypothetical protein
VAVPEKAIRELQICVDEARTIVEQKGILDALLVVTHRIRIETENLVRDCARARVVGGAFESDHCDLELVDSALAIAILEQRFTELPVQLPISRIVSDNVAEALNECRTRFGADGPTSIQDARVLRGCPLGGCPMDGRPLGRWMNERQFRASARRLGVEKRGIFEANLPLRAVHQ